VFLLNEGMEITQCLHYETQKSFLIFAIEKRTYRATISLHDPALCTPWPRIGRTFCRREPGKPEAAYPSPAATTSPDFGVCRSSLEGSV